LLLRRVSKKPLLPVSLRQVPEQQVPEPLEPERLAQVLRHPG
jgi:hypothetical protein